MPKWNLRLLKLLGCGYLWKVVRVLQVIDCALAGYISLVIKPSVPLHNAILISIAFRAINSEKMLLLLIPVLLYV